MTVSTKEQRGLREDSVEYQLAHLDELDVPDGELLALDDRVYFAERTGVRKGWLDLVNQSPAHLAAYLEGVIEEPSAALRVGKYLHCAVLEPDLLASRYYRQPPGNRTLKAVKEAVKEAAADNPGKVGVRAEEWDLAVHVRDAVYGHRGARAVMDAEGACEQSIFWREPTTDERCKARYDKVSVGKAFIADAKFVRDASPKAFGRAIVNYRYDVQAQHYAEPTGLRFVFLAVEKTPPYAVAVYAAGDDVLARGRRLRVPNVRTYAECRASGRWPGYPQTIQRAVLPRYARL